ncbi:MAG: cyclase family protein [Fuerstiella sp.]|jgi:hypothetical protein|nr:cyclase family protein [Fuerstiella sp.]MCP4505703.1 cyclase family protein [Fuerstiella sp.]
MCFFVRGILLDVCTLRGNDCLPAGYVISSDELEMCLSESRLQIQEGAFVLIHTGHGKLVSSAFRTTFVLWQPGRSSVMQRPASYELV